MFLSTSKRNMLFYAIIGHSGSGKSTLIQVLGLLEPLTTGTYLYNSVDVETFAEDEKAVIRAKKIGFIFQNYYLDPCLKAFENVMLPMYVNEEIAKQDRKEKAIQLLEKLGLQDRIYHFSKELSGGEQQRVMNARALANDPDIILADEPTGSLDEENEKIIFDLLKKISEEGKCVIVVSHSNVIANMRPMF